VKEDATELILNLKKVVLRMEDDRPRMLKIEKKGEGIVTAGTSSHEGGVEIINPEHHIATLARKQSSTWR